MESKRLFVLGGTGFIGREAVREAVALGWEVRALARSEEKAAGLRAMGAVPVLGDASAPRGWIEAARGADALVDLVQPEVPRRVRPKDVEAISRARQAMTRALVQALREMEPDARPVLMSVSGVDDLAPDAEGRIDGSSELRATPVGFGHIGVPVRRLVEAAGIASTFVYLGTVYGPGKSFAATIFPALARGRMLLPRADGNRLPLVHVRDAARAIVHLAGLARDRLAGRSFIVVDEEGGARLGELFDGAAAWMGVAPPARVPGWILSRLTGRILFETLTRDLQAQPSDLVASGFRFSYPTVREGIPATLEALGYAPRGPAARHGGSSRFRALLAASLAAIAAVNGLDVPLTVPRLRRLAGGLTILDMRLGYTPGAAYQLLDALGPGGRAMYLEMLWTVDLLLPALFTAFLWTAVSRGRLRRWRWIAVSAGVSDYLENAAITTLLVGYPARASFVAWIAAALTVSKLSLYLAALATAAGGAWLSRGSSRVQGAGRRMTGAA